MSEFEIELEKNMKLGKVAHERESFYSDFLVSKRDIERIFEEWQTPKPLVEVPQIVADYIETQKDNNYNGNASLIVKHYDSFKDEGNDSELNIWIANNFNDFLNAIVNGYTVKKEQLYHVVLPEVLNRYLNFRINNGDAMFGSSEETGNYKTKFTEQEIKDIDPRYWEFAVKVEG